MHKFRPIILSKETWLFAFITLVNLCVLARFVDLTPQVDYDVFFSSEDQSYKDDIEISRLFPRSDSQLIISITGDIYSPEYLRKIKSFGDLLSDISYVKDIKSVMHGPRSIQDAVQSPFWRRLLISNQENSTNIVVILDGNASQDILPIIIPRVDNLKKAFNAPDFQVQISGFPYIVEMIRHYLARDLRVFTSLAFVVFGLVAILIFHSWRILLGMIIASLNAGAITLMLSDILDVKIGILTANLATIVFVMTLSHIVFMTYNWKHISRDYSYAEAAREAIVITFPASFWSMFTTLLGFISLLFVEAKPIHELGIAGSLGTLVAFMMAYGFYPAFLKLQRPSGDHAELQIKHVFKYWFLFLLRRQGVVIILMIGLLIFTAPYLKSLDIDPSLLSFFNKKSEITEGLRYIDESGGSNPLVCVIKSKDGQPLDSKANFQRMWYLQRDLEQHEDVGIVISMPLIVAEARRSSPVSFIFSTSSIMDVIENSRYGIFTRGFITPDRQYALYLLRMKESGRTKHRVMIMNELNDIIEKNNLFPHLMGGIYALQGKLSEHVAESVVWGLGNLFILFAIIALISSHSIRASIAMIISIFIIPVGILGTIGAIKLPLDIIAAPAANIAISMGIDSMLHMVHAHRRLKKQGVPPDQNWMIVRKRYWEPVFTSMFIVSAGFGIFFFSSFPPTQRFGGSIVLGTVISAFSALFIFPLIADNKKN